MIHALFNTQRLCLGLGLGLALATSIYESKSFAMQLGGPLAKYLADKDEHKDDPIPQEALKEAKNKNVELALLSAEEQRNQQWMEIERSEYKNLPTGEEEPGQLNSLHMLRNVEHIKRVFSKDIAPYAPAGYKKHTHMMGTVAKVKLIITQESKYTGIFKTGGIALARASRIKMGGAMGSFDPNISVQVYRDKKTPVSYLTMCTVDGQGHQLNFFLNPFTNAPGPANEIPANLINDRFNKAAKELEAEHQGTRLTDDDIKDFLVLPLTEHASMDRTGQIEANPVAPFEVIFIATPEVQEAYEKELRKDKDADFRTIIAKALKPGDVLVRLYVREEALSKKIWKERWVDEKASKKFYDKRKIKEKPENMTLLGEVVLESGFIASEAGDKLRPRHPL